MPFIRHTRDKRGYDQTFVMHAYRPGQGAGRTRVLYFFRSPSGLKIGRRALDPEVTEALEHTHPDLSFDWTNVIRDVEAPRQDPRDRDRQRRPPPRPPQSRPAPQPAPVPTPVVLEDDTLLGRTLGAETSLRLRQRYSELLHRIARRARSPEDRDRLTEQAGRLNPDDWADEAAIRAGAATVEAEWQRISTELPHRRRGRRGGRPRTGPEPSAIIEKSGPTHDSENDTAVAMEDRAVSNGGDDPRVGSTEADSGEAAPGAGGFPRGD